MKILIILCTSIFLCSCWNKEHYEYIIVDEGQINNNVISKLDTPSKALLKWYLFAYGNECISNSISIKCKLLKQLNVDNECNDDNINFLKSWLSENRLIYYKFNNNCPLLPHKGAIQNKIFSIVIKRYLDIFEISFNAKGLNSIQEKTWDISQSDSYKLEGKTLIKI